MSKGFQLGNIFESMRWLLPCLDVLLYATQVLNSRPGPMPVGEMHIHDMTVDKMSDCHKVVSQNL
jgi:hypothetical protein